MNAIDAEREPEPSAGAPRHGDTGRSLPWWTWLVPGIVCHVGTQISLLTLVAPGVSAVYLPIPFALAMTFWWGPRALAGLYVNATLSAGLWGLHTRTLWPVYALPETIAVFLGWLLFIRIGRGRACLPNLDHVLRFIVMAVLPAAMVNAFGVPGQLVLLGDLRGELFWRASWTGWIATMLDGLAVAAPMVILLTPALERRELSLTSGSREARADFSEIRVGRALEIVATFGGMLLLGRLIPFDRYWSVCGLFLMWAALRHGVAIAVLANLWLEILVMLLPAVLGEGSFGGVLPSIEIENEQMALATLCLASLVTGRTISDQASEIARRRRVEADLVEERRALRISEERMSAVVRNPPDVAIQWYDKEGRVRLWNDASTRMFGFTPEEAVGKTLDQLIHTPEQQARFLKTLAEVDRTGAPIAPTEYHFQRRDGDPRVCLSTIFRIPGMDDGSCFFVCMDVDITERQRAQEALRQSEERFRDLAEQATDGIFIADADGRYVDVNRAGSEMLGYTREEILSLHLADILAPEEVPRLAPVVTALLAGDPMRSEWRFRRKDGSFFDGEVSGKLLPDGRMMGMVRDISERKRLDAGLRASEERFRALARFAPVGILQTDAAGNCIFVNERWCELAGVAAEAALGKPWSAPVHPDDRERIRAEWNRAEAEGAEFKTVCRFLTPAGEVRWLRADAVALRRSEKGPSGYLGSVTDITEDKRAEERQRLMMLELDHRVKNNLASVVSMADQMIARAHSLEEFRVSFMGRILAMARTHETLASNKWDAVDVSALLEIALGSYGAARDGRYTLVGEAAVLPPRIASPLCMAIHELAANASKYGALSVPSGRVSVRWELRAARSQLHLTWVERDGPAVAPPTRRGFGSELIKGMIEFELGGKVSIDHRREGLVASISIPMDIAGREARGVA